MLNRDKLRQLVQFDDTVCDYILSILDEEVMFAQLESESKTKRKAYLEKAIPELQVELTALKEKDEPKGIK